MGGGGDQVDVVAPPDLKREHHLRQPLGGDGLAQAAVADVPVLAEDAAQVAAGEEDRPRAALADQDILLAEVRAVAMDQALAAGAADPPLPGAASTRQACVQRSQRERASSVARARRERSPEGWRVR